MVTRARPALPSASELGPARNKPPPSLLGKANKGKDAANTRMGKDGVSEGVRGFERDEKKHVKPSPQKTSRCVTLPMDRAALKSSRGIVASRSIGPRVVGVCVE